MDHKPNQIYDNDGFYNEYQKNRYLNNLSDESKSYPTRIFYRSKNIEEQFGIDLYDFNLFQIEKLLYYLAPSTLGASRSNFYAVKNYIDWSIEEDLRENNINPLNVFSESQYYKKFIDEARNPLYTKDEIERMCNVCNNAQDEVVIRLIFEGVLGDSGKEELLNLQKKDVKDNNYLEVRGKSGSRMIRVSNECINSVKKALSETYYLKKNGYAKETLRSKIEVDLVKNNFVLKNVATRNKTDGRADPALVSRRVKAVQSYNNDWVKVLTPSIIRKSGMLYMASELYKKYGKLEREQYDEISKQFGIKMVNNNGYMVYNYFRHKEEFLNIDTIKKYYPDIF